MLLLGVFGSNVLRGHPRTATLHGSQDILSCGRNPGTRRQTGKHALADTPTLKPAGEHTTSHADAHRPGERTRSLSTSATRSHAQATNRQKNRTPYGLNRKIAGDGNPQAEALVRACLASTPTPAQPRPHAQVLASLTLTALSDIKLTPRVRALESIA